MSTKWSYDIWRSIYDEDTHKAMKKELGVKNMDYYFKTWMNDSIKVLLTKMSDRKRK
jgi:hypothetical protein